MLLVSVLPQLDGLVLDAALCERFPTLWGHLQRQRLLLPLRAFLLDACRLLFAPLSPRLALTALDLLLADGPAALLRLALALCKRHRAQLLACADPDSLSDVLRGMAFAAAPTSGLDHPASYCSSSSSSSSSGSPNSSSPDSSSSSNSYSCPCRTSSICAESSRAQLSVSTANLFACLDSGLLPVPSAAPAALPSQATRPSVPPVKVGPPCPCWPSSAAADAAAASSLACPPSLTSAPSSAPASPPACPCECCWLSDLVRSAYSEPRFQGLEQGTLDQLRVAGAERCRREADLRKKRRARLDVFIRCGLVHTSDTCLMITVSDQP
jgi:hypothetical protein